MTVFKINTTTDTLRLVRANQVLYCDNPSQMETLLDPIQLLAAGNTVVFTPRMFWNVDGNQGRQGMKIGDLFMFCFDGQQLFVRHRLPTDRDIDNSDTLEPTRTGRQSTRL
jgi:hypothetical protein